MKFYKFCLLIGCILFTANLMQAQNTNKKSTNTKAKTAATTKQKPVQAHPGVHMTFENEHIVIGKVKKGEIKKFDFVFTNTGTDAIEIDIASGCDCTTLDYPRHKILPGKKGTIHVTFDSAKKDESETIDVDIYLKNLNPKTGHRILKIVDYTYELVK